MKVALDPSVLVAGLVKCHPHHPRAVPWLRAAQAGSIEVVIALHALAETWATLTALPLDPRITGEQASRMLQKLCEFARVVDPSRPFYQDAVDACVAIGARSGAIYDALHYVSACHARADAVLTFNVKDFQRLCRSENLRVCVPPEPPEVRLA